MLSHQRVCAFCKWPRPPCIRALTLSVRYATTAIASPLGLAPLGGVRHPREAAAAELQPVVHGRVPGEVPDPADRAPRVPEPDRLEEGAVREGHLHCCSTAYPCILLRSVQAFGICLQYSTPMFSAAIRQLLTSFCLLAPGPRRSRCAARPPEPPARLLRLLLFSRTPT